MARILAAIALSLACAQCLAAAAPLRILFIGNSLTYTNDLPGRLARVAAATGRKAIVESVTEPNYSLADHWNGKAATEALAKGWDVVVFQQGSSREPGGRRMLIEYSKLFSDAIRKAGAKPALYMVWPLYSRPNEFIPVIESHRMAAEAADAMLLPAGEAWYRALAKERGLDLYRDAIHPTAAGSDLAVLTIYFSLFPAGPQEFDEAFVAKIAAVLDIPKAHRDLFFDVATRAIDSPLAIQ